MYFYSPEVMAEYPVINRKGPVKPLKIKPSAIKPIDIILRSKHLKNYILYPVVSFRRRQESNSYKYFLDSPVKPGNDGGGGFRIPGPALALKLMFSLS
jgi:hypothetical protein